MFLWSELDCKIAKDSLNIFENISLGRSLRLTLFTNLNIFENISPGRSLLRFFNSSLILLVSSLLEVQLDTRKTMADMRLRLLWSELDRKIAKSSSNIFENISLGRSLRLTLFTSLNIFENISPGRSLLRFFNSTLILLVSSLLEVQLDTRKTMARVLAPDTLSLFSFLRSSEIRERMRRTTSLIRRWSLAIIQQEAYIELTLF